MSVVNIDLLRSPHREQQPGNMSETNRKALGSTQTGRGKSTGGGDESPTAVGSMSRKMERRERRMGEEGPGRGGISHRL